MADFTGDIIVKGGLDEFLFRFNQRLSQHRSKLFHRLVHQAVTMRPPPVKSLHVPKAQGRVKYLDIIK